MFVSDDVYIHTTVVALEAIELKSRYHTYVLLLNIVNIVITDGHAGPAQKAEEGQADGGGGLEDVQGRRRGRTNRAVLVGGQGLVLDPASAAAEAQGGERAGAARAGTNHAADNV